MNHPIAEIFSQGEEVVNGHIADTNAAWLSQKLAQMGFRMQRHTVVGDKLEDLAELLTEISKRTDFCICTGGLGPTVDDLTAEAAAKAFKKNLELDQQALIQIERYFLNRDRIMADSNRKQAYFPQGAQRIDNHWGTAPGFAIKFNRCWFVFLPGVPTEMRHMFNDYIEDLLNQQFNLQAEKLIAIKSIGIGESDLQQKINQHPLPDKVQLSFRAAKDEVQTKLTFPLETSETEINDCVNQLVKVIGDPVYVIDEPGKFSSDLVSVIDQLMQEKKYTISILETASQGLISAKCIGYDWLLDSSYKQSTELISKQFGLSKSKDIAELSLMMAKKLKQSQQTDLILVQLYQGNKAQFQDKEQSIVLYNALLTPSGISYDSMKVTGPIKRKQNQAAIRALDLLRRYLQNCAINKIK